MFVWLAGIVFGGSMAVEMRAANARSKQANDPARRVFAQHCQKCHSGAKPKGDFQIEQLSEDFADQKNREQWLKVLEQIRDGEMPPKDIPNAADLIGRTRLLFDLTHLALQTDSTRLITIMLAGSTFAPPIEGVTLGHHDLSHHGKDPGKLAQLKIVEEETMKTVATCSPNSNNRRKPMQICSTAPPSSSAAISATAAAIPRRIFPSFSLAAASSMATTWPSIPTTRHPFAISTSACCNASASKPTDSAPALGR